MVKDHSDSERVNHMGYSFRLAAIVLLYAPSHRQDSTYHDLCYTSRGALAGTRNSSRPKPTRCDVDTFSFLGNTRNNQVKKQTKKPNITQTKRKPEKNKEEEKKGTRKRKRNKKQQTNKKQKQKKK